MGKAGWSNHYKAMPEAEWDGTAMLYCEDTHQYFADWQEVVEDTDAKLPLDASALSDEDVEQLARTRPLVICVPCYGRRIGDDYFEDELAEDETLAYVAPRLADLIAAVNAHIEAKLEVLGWSPGKTRLRGQVEPAPVTAPDTLTGEG